uniref:Uncharacterized protein n=1 Tax=Rhizophora mucronata TaxID=61149 RepID=A0A2P2N730_RHIMU
MLVPLVMGVVLCLPHQWHAHTCYPW